MSINHTVKYLKSTNNGVIDVIETRKLTRSKAIRLNCLDCSGGISDDVRTCNIVKCPLWPFRLGRNPEGIVSATHKKAIAEEK